MFCLIFIGLRIPFTLFMCNVHCVRELKQILKVILKVKLKLHRIGPCHPAGKASSEKQVLRCAACHCCLLLPSLAGDQHFTFRTGGFRESCCLLFISELFAQVTDTGLEHLHACSSLASVDLLKCWAITPAGVSGADQILNDSSFEDQL